MKSTKVILLALGVISLAGCVTREKTVVERPVVHERTVIAPGGVSGSSTTTTTETREEIRR